MKKYWRVGLVVVIVAALLGLIGSNLEWEEYTVPAQLRGDAARNPFYAAEQFVRALGARAESRQALGDLPPPPAGVLVLQYWRWNLIPSRRMAIERWVEAGGRLVIDAALWDDDEVFAAWTGLSLEHATLTEGEDTDAPAYDESCRPLIVMHDVAGVSQGHASYQVCTTRYPSYLASKRDPQWSLRDRRGMRAVRVGLQRGSVTWLNADQVFGNRNLSNAEHGLLFVAVTQLRPGDQVIFASESGHPSLLALIWKHGAAVVIVAALALLTFLWRSSARFGPRAQVPELARRSLVEQIRGSGRFVRRYGNGTALHGAALRALYEVAQRRLARWSSLSQEQREIALAQAADVTPAEIHEALQNVPRSSHDLKRTLERLEQMRRRLLEKSQYAV